MTFVKITNGKYIWFKSESDDAWNRVFDLNLNWKLLDKIWIENYLIKLNENLFKLKYFIVCLIFVTCETISGQYINGKCK